MTVMENFHTVKGRDSYGHQEKKALSQPCLDYLGQRKASFSFQCDSGEYGPRGENSEDPSHIHPPHPRPILPATNCPSLEAEFTYSWLRAEIRLQTVLVEAGRRRNTMCWTTHYDKYMYVSALSFNPCYGMTDTTTGSQGSERPWTYLRSQSQEEDPSPDLFDSRPSSTFWP